MFKQNEDYFSGFSSSLLSEECLVRRCLLREFALGGAWFKDKKMEM